MNNCYIIGQWNLKYNTALYLEEKIAECGKWRKIIGFIVSEMKCRKVDKTIIE